VMASQVRPRLTQPARYTGPQQSTGVIRRQPAYSIRARDFASHSQAGCIAAIKSCEEKPKRNALQGGGVHVCIEDLKVRNMSKSSRGSAATPGRNVRAKSGLNKAILDQGWFEFRRQLEYKLNWAGGRLVVVPPHYTSLTCPDCDYVSARNRTSQAKFKCVQCGYENHADVVGALNVLARGYRVTACGNGMDAPAFYGISVPKWKCQATT